MREESAGLAFEKKDEEEEDGVGGAAAAWAAAGVFVDVVDRVVVADAGVVVVVVVVVVIVSVVAALAPTAVCGCCCCLLLFGVKVAVAVFGLVDSMRERIGGTGAKLVYMYWDMFAESSASTSASSGGAADFWGPWAWDPVVRVVVALVSWVSRVLSSCLGSSCLPCPLWGREDDNETQLAGGSSSSNGRGGGGKGVEGGLFGDPQTACGLWERERRDFLGVGAVERRHRDQERESQSQSTP